MGQCVNLSWFDLHCDDSFPQKHVGQNVWDHKSNDLWDRVNEIINEGKGEENRDH